MAHFNEAGQRVSPHGNQPYGTIYGNGVMPDINDPGWVARRVKATGETLHMIHVHGPFDVIRDGQEVHCHEGWLALDLAGALLAILDADPDSSSTEEVG